MKPDSAKAAINAISEQLKVVREAVAGNRLFEVEAATRRETNPPPRVMPEQPPLFKLKVRRS